jgi:hypothetical protein
MENMKSWPSLSPNICEQVGKKERIIGMSYLYQNLLLHKCWGKDFTNSFQLGHYPSPLLVRAFNFESQTIYINYCLRGFVSTRIQSLEFHVKYLYYYIKHLRIGGSIFCHGNFLLYPFYPSIRRQIFIFG